MNLGTWEKIQPGNRGNYNLDEMPPDDNLRICSTWDDLSNLENLTLVQNACQTNLENRWLGCSSILKLTGAPGICKVLSFTRDGTAATTKPLNREIDPTGQNCPDRGNPRTWAFVDNRDDQPNL